MWLRGNSVFHRGLWLAMLASCLWAGVVHAADPTWIAPEAAPRDGREGYSFDLGLSVGEAQGLAFFLRYARWAVEEFIVSEHPDGLASREHSLGARFRLF